MRYTVDWIKYVMIGATLLIGASGITYAFIAGWRTAETLLQYLTMLAATVFYVAGVGSIIYGLGYAMWLRVNGRSAPQRDDGQASEHG